LLGPALPLRQGLALQLFAALLARCGLGQGGLDLLVLLLAAGFGIRNRLACRAAGLFQIFLCIGQQAVGKTIAPVLAGRDGGRFGLLEQFKLAGQGVELGRHVARCRLDDAALILTILGQLALVGGFQLGLSARDGGELLRLLLLQPLFVGIGTGPIGLGLSGVAVFRQLGTHLAYFGLASRSGDHVVEQITKAVVLPRAPERQTIAALSGSQGPLFGLPAVGIALAGKDTLAVPQYLDAMLS